MIQLLTNLNTMKLDACSSIIYLGNLGIRSAKREDISLKGSVENVWFG